MTILDRFKLELNNRPYLTDDNYKKILFENNLKFPEDEYFKVDMQRNLLLSVLDVLEILSNDIDVMRRVESETLTTDEAAKYLDKRKADLRNRIACIPNADDKDSSFKLMFTSSRGLRRS